MPETTPETTPETPTTPTNGHRISEKRLAQLRHPNPTFHLGRAMARAVVIYRYAQGSAAAASLENKVVSAGSRPLEIVTQILNRTQRAIAYLSRGEARQGAAIDIHNYEEAVELIDAQALPRTFQAQDQVLFWNGYNSEKNCIRARQRIQAAESANKGG